MNGLQLQIVKPPLLQPDSDQNRMQLVVLLQAIKMQLATRALKVVVNAKSVFYVKTPPEPVNLLLHLELQVGLETHQDFLN